jgi:hypothetical protein
MPPSTQISPSSAHFKQSKGNSGIAVIERAIETGQFSALVDRLDPMVIRQAQMQRLGLVHAAMRLADVGQRNKTMSVLVNFGVDVNAMNVHRRTPLHDAVERYDLDGMDVLMGLGADLNAQDGTGKTPLHLSAQKGRIRPATRLIGAGASAMVRDDDGKLFTDLGDESFVEHMELLMDVRKTMRILDVAMERHAGVPIPESRDPHDRHESHADGWLVSGD